MRNGSVWGSVGVQGGIIRSVCSVRLSYRRLPVMMIPSEGGRRPSGSDARLTKVCRPTGSLPHRDEIFMLGSDASGQG